VHHEDDPCELCRAPECTGCALERRMKSENVVLKAKIETILRETLVLCEAVDGIHCDVFIDNYGLAAEKITDLVEGLD